MLKNIFYSITCKNGSAATGALQYEIEFNAHHDVFKGHFPGNPVVPGVFIIQLIQELAEDALQKRLRLAAVKKVKFLSIVTPDKGSRMVIDLTFKQGTDAFPVDATALFMNQPCLKLNARFIAEP